MFTTEILQMFAASYKLDFILLDSSICKTRRILRTSFESKFDQLSGRRLASDLHVMAYFLLAARRRDALEAAHVVEMNRDFGISTEALPPSRAPRNGCMRCRVPDALTRGTVLDFGSPSSAL